MTTALITGANRGIGLALTNAFIRRGMFVIAAARRPESAADLDALHRSNPEKLDIVSMDVTDADSVKEAGKKASGSLEHLDVLVNNAGVLLEAAETKFANLDVGQFDQTFCVNVTGAARVTQAFLPLLLKSDRPRIVNISSGAGSISSKGDHKYYCYGASKAALNHLTVGLAHELRPKNVIVAVLSPGWVKTSMGGPDAELSPDESAAAMADTILSLSMDDSGRFLGRTGSKETYPW